ncbi:protein kinase domain-containing protein [Corynebacterium liangguodongii]|uniref:non-specific serine/threonine protein kinase n=1 Tax=Corynebacterium liangguodongii TaxID=2079535 RepID=A0A2S0WF08_9CORY|nr:protein kinase [Corynebacterium liangguodongii]AWB84367.1 serine/threonine protein kinase [Corynebacterium liangguodongii]PWB99857.1 serine/threonine protein kinase [Corynebacterium liangguodongii]
MTETELGAGEFLDNRYVIDRPIARGGMSTVYRCVDTRLGRAVAAKVMDARYVHDRVFLDRFEREARAMAQLSHPNLVGVYDFSHDEDEGLVFLIMELITGGTLRELLAERGPMPPHAASAVMRATLTGLSVAHRKSLVHRDIKPDNILISADHTVKLADFGLVRAAAADARHTTDQIVGTVSYLSPEQVDGSPITQASDVYSAGIVLFELLTGTVPFAGETPLAHAYARLSRDVPRASSRIAGVPKLFDELVATATARDPRDRFVDAAEFLAALVDVTAELGLTDYVVPLPANSAANRAAAQPTSLTALTALTAARPPAAAAPQPREAEHVLDQRLFPQPAAGSTKIVAPPPVAVRPPAPTPVSNRGPGGLIAFCVAAALTIALVALGAWWFGSGMYGQLPALLA